MKKQALDFLKSDKNSKWYYVLVVLRIILTCLPQTGYIHPDEFFQSIEVLAEDIFNVESIRPWEFNASFPIRSIVIPKLIVGTPYKILKNLDYFSQLYFNVDLKVPYFLIVFPRLFNCLGSFLIDYCLYRICKISGVSFKNKLLVLASSYVILVYGTRTFSNTIEMILISVLLCFVVECHLYSHAVIRQEEFLSKKYKKVKVGIERVMIYKLKSSLPTYSLRHCIYISLITVLGIFNRPTFFAFAFPPVFFWLHRGIGYKSFKFSHFHVRMLAFLGCSSLFTMLFIVVDSFYFGYLSIAEISQLEISLDNFVVTPYNFIRHNVNVKNLSQHGLHPKFLHLLVNVPLLYNILGVLGFVKIGGYLYKMLIGRYGRLPKLHSIEGMMTVSAITPIAVLSYFPHQEPRFLIPTLLPFVYLYAEQVCSPKVMCTSLKIWCFLNLICTLFFGFIHQAGIYPLTSHLAKQTKFTTVHVISSHLYSLPISLVHRRSTRSIYSMQGTKYKLAKSLFVHEMGSEPLGTVLKRIENILHVYKGPKSTELYLALPTSKKSRLDYLLSTNYTNLSVETVKLFYPHISTEAFPELHHCNDEETSFSIKLYNLAMDTINSCGLGFYHIFYKNSSSSVI